MKNISLMALSLLLYSCTNIPDQAYHKISCIDKNSCTNQELDSLIKPVTDVVVVNSWSASLEKNVKNPEKKKLYKTNFNLFYLEYDHNGEKFEGNRQLDLIKRAITTSNKPVYLVVFVHGWHNNASINPNSPSLDTTGFPYLLARRSFRNPDMNVIGVYVGWQGEEYIYNPAKLLSIKERTKVADTIGRKGNLRADLINLSKTVQGNNSLGSSLIIGHSLGGRILSRSFMNDLENTKVTSDWVLGEHSLLVTLNPAIGADAFDKIYANMPGIEQNIQRPLWINLTSKDDKSVSKVFPAARLIGMNLSDNPNSGKKEVIGHYMPYLSHEVTTINEFDYKPECNFTDPEAILKTNTPWFKLPPNHDDHVVCATRHLYEYPDFYVDYGHSQYYTTILRPLYENRYKPQGYLWNFRVDSSLIDFSSNEAKINHSYRFHNAFVQTTLGRMLDEMLFTSPIDLPSD